MKNLSGKSFWVQNMISIALWNWPESSSTINTSTQLFCDLLIFVQDPTITKPFPPSLHLRLLHLQLWMTVTDPTKTCRLFKLITLENATKHSLQHPTPIGNQNPILFILASPPTMPTL